MQYLIGGLAVVLVVLAIVFVARPAVRRALRDGMTAALEAKAMRDSMASPKPGTTVGGQFMTGGQAHVVYDREGRPVEWAFQAYEPALASQDQAVATPRRVNAVAAAVSAPPEPQTDIPVPPAKNEPAKSEPKPNSGKKEEPKPADTKRGA